MKNKADFYIAFYERLALQGFKAYNSAYEGNIADICVNGNNIAHLTKTDHIVSNPYAKLDSSVMDTLRQIAKSTAYRCGFCTEKPYDETKHEKLPDGSYKISEFDGTVLACSQHHLFGYVFYTFTQQSENGQTDERQTIYNKSNAMRDFAVRSGLVDGRQFFTDKELSAIHNTLSNYVMMPENGLDFESGQEVDNIILKIENIIPAFDGNEISTDLEIETDMYEGVEQ